MPYPSIGPYPRSAYRAIASGCSLPVLSTTLRWPAKAAPSSRAPTIACASPRRRKRGTTYTRLISATPGDSARHAPQPAGSPSISATRKIPSGGRNSAASTTAASRPPYRWTYSSCTCSTRSCATGWSYGSGRSVATAPSRSSAEVDMSGPFRAHVRDDVRGRPAVDEHGGAARSRPYGPDRRPAVRESRARGEGRDQGVVLPAGQDPGHRVDAERRAHLLQGARRLQAGLRERAPVEVDRHLAVGGEVAEVGQQPVAHVAHRRRPRLGGRGPRRVRRRRTPVRRHRGDRTGEPPAQHGQAAGRPSQPAGQRHHVP